MAKLTVEFVEHGSFTVELKNLSKEIKADILKYTEEAAVLISDQAKKNLTENKSVRTGTLRRSVGYVVYKSNLWAEIGTNVFYGPYVEFGTSRAAAKPYLHPAFDKYEPVYIDAIRRLLKTILPGAK